MSRTPKRRSRGAALLLEQITRAVYEGRKAGGMFPTQWAALRFFDRAGEKACTVAGLAGYLGVTRGPASRTASSLVNRGLVVARENPDDGRIPLFSLTHAGQEALAQDPLTDLAVAIDQLEGDTDRQFFSTLDDVFTALKAKRNVK